MAYTYQDNGINPRTGAISSRNIIEELTVGTGTAVDYGVQLRDGIVQGSLIVTENTTGGTEFTQVTGAPAAGQVSVQYSDGVSARGILEFNSADNGKNVVVEYSGYGSLTTKDNLQSLVSNLQPTTKGGLITYDTSAVQLSVGNDGEPLIANSAASKGLEYTSRFTIDPDTGQLANSYQVSVGTGYPDTVHNGWLCRGWVNFDGTGTVAIRAAANVSSITDNGTGDYTINFATALPDADYVIVPAVSYNYTAAINPQSVSINTNSSRTETAPTTSAFRLFTYDSGSGVDRKYVSVAVFR